MSGVSRTTLPRDTPLQICTKGQNRLEYPWDGCGFASSGITDGLDDARKLDQQSIAHGLDDVAVVGGDRRIDYFPSEGFETCERGLFIGAHEAAVANHVGDQNGGKFTLNTRISHSGPPHVDWE